MLDGCTHPDVFQESAGLLKLTKVKMIEGGGHFIPHDSATEFNTILSDFIKELP